MHKIKKWFRSDFRKHVKSKKGFYRSKSDFVINSKEQIKLIKKWINAEIISQNVFKFKSKYFFFANITYLGHKDNENRSYKKRIQISSKKYRDIYNKNPNNRMFFGIYQNHYNENVFVVWDRNKLKIGKNASMHVNANDLNEALKKGYIEKFDKSRSGSNKLWVFKPTHSQYVFDKINKKNPFDDFIHYTLMNNSVWDYKNSILEMRKTNYRNWKQIEWGGFYLEFIAENFFKNYKSVDSPTRKKFNQWRPDAFYIIPIDYKFHSLNNKNSDIAGNDYDGVMKAIEEYGKIKIYVAIGEVTKNLEVNKWRKKLLNQQYEYNKKTRVMKEKIVLKSFKVLEIDKEYLKNTKLFKQGINSNGKPRKAKIMFDLKKYIKKYS